MWLGEQITAKGVGNGISILIFAGIVAAIPNASYQLYQQQIQNIGDQLFMSIVKVALILLAVLSSYCWCYFIQQAVRKIPIQYAKRVTGGNGNHDCEHKTLIYHLR